jgi:hypothetical protein
MKSCKHSVSSLSVSSQLSRCSKSLKLASLSVVFALAFSACAPRGESKSLTEVLEAAKERYALVKDVSTSPEVTDSLKAVLTELDAVENSKGVLATSNANKLALTLNGLIEHAGFTSRPAMTELMNQYLHVAEHGAQNADATLLLASRTYSLLASELETTKFGV